MKMGRGGIEESAKDKIWEVERLKIGIGTHIKVVHTKACGSSPTRRWLFLIGISGYPLLHNPERDIGSRK